MNLRFTWRLLGYSRRLWPRGVVSEYCMIRNGMAVASCADDPGCARTVPGWRCCGLVGAGLAGDVRIAGEAVPVGGNYIF